MPGLTNAGEPKYSLRPGNYYYVPAQDAFPEMLCDRTIETSSSARPNSLACDPLEGRGRGHLAALVSLGTGAALPTCWRPL